MQARTSSKNLFLRGISAAGSGSDPDSANGKLSCYLFLLNILYLEFMSAPKHPKMLIVPSFSCS